MKKLQSLIMAGALLGTLLISTLSPMPVRAQTAPTNLIANPSVESGSTQPDNWQPDQWGNNSASLSYATTGHTGSKSLYVSVSNYQDGDAKWIMDPVSVNPNTTYTYSDFYKSNVATELDVKYTDSTGVDTYVYLTTVNPAANWTQVTIQFTTPANVNQVAVLHIDNANGWLQTDDFSLTGAAQSKITAALFRLTLPTTPRSCPSAKVMPVLGMQSMRLPKLAILCTPAVRLPK